jgi:chemotaxis protein CheC
MEDVRDLKALQIDALREVANIGAGHARRPLSQMTDRRIMISVPQINIRAPGGIVGRSAGRARPTSSPPC